MKNRSFLVILLVSLSLGLFSCSENALQKVNEDKNDPTEMASKLIITDVITSTSYSITGADLALYASVYVEYNVGTYNQMADAELRVTQPSVATTYNNSWINIYANLFNLKVIIEKCSPGGDEEDNTTVLGMAQILSAYNLAILTDLMGDVPWTEALQPGVVLTPQLDSQKSIYEVINQFITDGISNLGKETSIPSIGAQDPLFGGSAKSWTKFAYGLKARYAMRLSKVAPNYDAVIDAASKSFATKSEEAAFKCGAVKNPFYQFFTDRDYFGASQSLDDKLADLDDPREDVFFKPYPGADDVVFAPNGNPDQVQGEYGISALATSTPTWPIYLMSYHELEFLKAEAYARKNDLTNAKTHLKTAIETCFTNVGLDTADADDYFSSIEPKMVSQATAVAEIMMQKYLGLFEQESIETYNDIRRLKAMGEGNTIILENTRKFPLRYSYGSDDVTANPNVASAYGDGSYVYTENVWWAGGSR